MTREAWVWLAALVGLFWLAWLLILAGAGLVVWAAIEWV